MDKITCQICGAHVHVIHKHLKDQHPDYSIEQYEEEFPEAPILSDKAKNLLAEKRQEAELKYGTGATAEVVQFKKGQSEEMVALNELFKLGKSKAAMARNGNPIMIKRLGLDNNAELIPEVDEGYVYKIDTLKNILLGLDLNIPTYLWGHMGTGKSTFFEQVCARTNRPLIRVQHTVNTEESHVVGQWTVKNGETVFELGPLAIAMKEGLIYMADEYDFALPSVLSVYQSVLEGKSLMIKEADAANRLIKPHPNFRFVATGNTNGSGDETGLYPGTMIQNAANYDRFGIVCRVEYMEAKLEERIIVNQAGVDENEAKLLVSFAKAVREAYDADKLSLTISPRALINAAMVGIRRGSLLTGLELAFINKLSTVDRESCLGIAQRIIGQQ